MSRIEVKKVHTYIGHNDSIYTLESVNDRQFLSAGGDGMVVLWNLENPAEGEVIAKTNGSIYAMVFDYENEKIIVGENNEGLHLIDFRQRKEIGSVKVGNHQIFDLKLRKNEIWVGLSNGEVVFFDRSWYNRAVVEPVMGFCSKKQYDKFMVQVPEFEHLLYEDNMKIIKFWFSISKKEQKKRFNDRLNNPLKRWKFSPVDMKGQELWDKYTHYKEQMFSKSHTNFSPWIIVKTNNKKQARLESMRYILSQFDYEGKGEQNVTLLPDPNVIMRYHRSAIQIDN
jgi:WD40 repeat protein